MVSTEIWGNQESSGHFMEGRRSFLWKPHRTYLSPTLAAFVAPASTWQTKAVPDDVLCSARGGAAE